MKTCKATNSRFPIEFDSHYVYIGGKRETITKKENRGKTPIHRYPDRPSIIGYQVKNGYVYFKHLGKKYRGYFKLISDSRYGIVRLKTV